MGGYYLDRCICDHALTNKNVALPLLFNLAGWRGGSAQYQHFLRVFSITQNSPRLRHLHPEAVVFYGFEQ